MFQWWAAICSHSLTKMSRQFRKTLKLSLFVHLLGQCVFVTFSTRTVPIDTKFSGRCLQAPTMLLQGSNRSSLANVRFRPSKTLLSKKTIFFSTFFHILAMRVTPKNVTAGKIGQRVAPLAIALDLAAS